MFSFFHKGDPSGHAGEGEGGGRNDGKLDPSRLQWLAEYFPIGKKLRYYPDFKQEIVFDTILLAYCINGHYCYSRDALELDGSGRLEAFLSADGEHRIRLREVSKFQLLVPDTSEQEQTLDYYHRAMIGRGRQFHKGNNITLLGSAGAQGLASLDTEVLRPQVLKEGPYANTNLVLLDPDLESGKISDQRRQARAQVCVPVTVLYHGASLAGPCTLVDMSEGAAKIRLRDGASTPFPALARGERLVLDLDLGGEVSRRYRLQGSVFRTTAETCVVRIDGALQEGQLVKLSALERLELKTYLLNAGRSTQAG